MPQFDAAYYAGQFGVTLEDRTDTVFGASLSSLAGAEGAESFIRAYAPLIKALEPDVAGTYFASWFGAVCAAFQYSLWHDNAKPDLSLDNVELQLYVKEQRAGMEFRVRQWESESLPDAAAHRSSQAVEAMEAFYGRQIRPLLESIAGVVGLNAGQLWGVIGTRLHYVKDRWLEEAETEEQRERLNHDLDQLLRGLDPAVFGRPKNPFDIRFRMMENPRKPGEQMRIKAVCCLAYKTDTGHGYCFTCPRLSERERQEKIDKIKAEAVR
ncbi:(2Fe-2S)-binding protein [Paenibacillus doosanensis]|uniref:Ferric siderophore reductase C-terminal domain-containing protein n=1 Tax=Paenibacillus konkukensis TaxID=2020716 RepID=A0ABY4RNW3_9BACL|nr:MULTISPECIES: (2Fe-2S)-binding protein [Paenibacillus]MCS7463955.1 (2Fe-2S)-binding protein [Paenibacillus doosanensis]UQZ83828.1 hypothetical protein SK3146_03035 [Paenibacillus konkukensis]